MGSYDTVTFICPVCNDAMHIQTKAGPCRLRWYKAAEVPAEIAASIQDQKVTCSCGYKGFAGVEHPIPKVAMRLYRSYPEEGDEGA